MWFYSGHQNILHLQFSKFTNNPAIIKVCEKKNPLSPAFYIYRVSLKPEKKILLFILVVPCSYFLVTHIVRLFFLFPSWLLIAAEERAGG